jgi:hypothetical protein
MLSNEIQSTPCKHLEMGVPVSLVTNIEISMLTIEIPSTICSHLEVNAPVSYA